MVIPTRVEACEMGLKHDYENVRRHGVASQASAACWIFFLQNQSLKKYRNTANINTTNYIFLKHGAI